MAQATAVEFTCGECGAQNRLPRERVLHLKSSPLCGRCDTPLFRAFDRDLDDLDPASYIHPLDREALDALRRIPGVTTLLRSLIRHSFELALRIHHHANFIQVDETQLPSVYEKLLFAAGALGIKQIPELYVFQDPIPKAETFGVHKCSIAISTGCLELLDDDELTCAIAQELGHVHADHVLYKSAAKVFGTLGDFVSNTFGIGGLFVYPIQLALLRWDRASELSADRAALLVMKNPYIVMRTLMKMAGGSPKLSDELSLNAFIKQADEFGKLQDEGPLGRYIAILHSVFRNQPFTIWRTKEVLNWVFEGNYLEILDGDYQTRSLIASKTCDKCKTENKVDALVCTNCGTSLVEEPPISAETERDLKAQVKDPIQKAWKDVSGWYKRNFTMDGMSVDEDGNATVDTEVGDDDEDDL